MTEPTALADNNSGTVVVGEVDPLSHLAIENDVIYHGIRISDANHRVTKEDSAGRVLGELRNWHPRKSTDLSWGYLGSGPAALARSLLLDVLPDPRCPSCAGTHQVILDFFPETNNHQERPFDPERDADDDERRAKCHDCDTDGYAAVPYQDFKFEYVAGWGEEWRISATEIRGWLEIHYPAGLGRRPALEPGQPLVIEG